MSETNAYLLKEPIPLSDGLILRRSRIDDTYRLSEFNGRIHGENDADLKRVASWTKDLMSGSHPTHHPDDFTVVEEKDTGKIVSAMNLISQVWSYDGIAFGVGRPELVGTDLAFRNRGLVRRQFEIIHEWSRSRGELLQAITGIPYYYRQFGYEMAVELSGRRIGYESNLPVLKENEQENFKIRHANPADLNGIMRIYNISAAGVRLHCLRDAAEWRYELDGRREDDVNRSVIQVIECKNGELVGYLLHPPYLWNDSMNLTGIELAGGISWQAVIPDVLRFLWKQGQAYAKAEGKTCCAFGLQLGSDHPAYQVALERLPTYKDPYAWYLRVAHLPGFLRKITPALESHLRESNCPGFDGVVKLGFYTSEIDLTFQKGKLLKIEDSRLEHWDKVDAAFPEFTFLQLLFGYRNREELEYAFPDCWVSPDFRPLIDALFPRKISHIWPIH
jgi:hypothetical protein